MMAHKFVFASVSLAFVGDVGRVRCSSEQLQQLHMSSQQQLLTRLRVLDAGLRPQPLARVSESEKSRAATDTLNPWRNLAILLLALNPAHAFNPSARVAIQAKAVNPFIRAATDASPAATMGQASCASLDVELHLSGWLELRLNRPEKLNALSDELVDALSEQVTRAREADVRGLLLTAAPGRAFCAGGDIREVAAMPLAQGQEFLRKEYSLMLALHQLGREKPVVALADGFVIGAGAGLFMASATRIATNTSSFSMPECVLGIIPDVGASDFLTAEKMPFSVGRWLALTGERIGAPLMSATGLATHIIPSNRVEDVYTSILAGVELDDKVYLHELEDHVSKEQEELQLFSQVTRRVFGPADAAPLESLDDKLAAEETAAKESGDEFVLNWAKQARSKLARGCPVSLLIADECFVTVLGEDASVRRSKALGMELVVNQALAGRADFQEGVACAVGSKKGEAPQWEHQSVKAASADPRVVEILELVRHAKPLSLDDV